MRLLVTGDRTWRDADYIQAVLDDINRFYGIDVVIEGCAAGVDELAGHHPPRYRNKRFIPAGWAYLHGKGFEHYPADWVHLGRSAGPTRNISMLRMGHPDMVVAFHPSLNTSKGTAHMVKIAREAGLPVYVFPHHTVDIGHLKEDGEAWLDAVKSGAVL